MSRLVYVSRLRGREREELRNRFLDFLELALGLATTVRALRRRARVRLERVVFSDGGCELEQVALELERQHVEPLLLRGRELIDGAQVGAR